MTKERIIKGAEELFFQYGIKSVTMDDIAKHLGMSKKTIYRVFPDKDEVVNTLMQIKIEEDKREFTHLVTSAENIVHEVFLMLKHMSNMFTKLNPALFYDLQKHHPEAWSKFKAFKEEFILGMVQSTIKKGIQQGYVRPDTDPSILARLRIEEIEMGFNPKLFPPPQFKIVDVQIALMEHFLYGICTLKGHKLINKFKQIVEED
jgi:TetR/AcrR family transcriptional regulator, cholesterol catabolism regulator